MNKRKLIPAVLLLLLICAIAVQVFFFYFGPTGFTTYCALISPIEGTFFKGSVLFPYDSSSRYVSVISSEPIKSPVSGRMKIRQDDGSWECSDVVLNTRMAYVVKFEGLREERYMYLLLRAGTTAQEQWIDLGESGECPFELTLNSELNAAELWLFCTMHKYKAAKHPSYKRIRVGFPIDVEDEMDTDARAQNEESIGVNPENMQWGFCEKGRAFSSDQRWAQPGKNAFLWRRFAGMQFIATNTKAHEKPFCRGILFSGFSCPLVAILPLPVTAGRCRMTP